MQADRGAGERDCGAVLDVPVGDVLLAHEENTEVGNILSAFRENNSKLNVVILNALGLFRALQKRHVENVSLTAGQRPKEGIEICVPSHAEGVVPSSEDGEPGLDLEVGLPLVAPESRRRHVPDHIRKVRIQASDLQGEPELLNGGAARVVILLLGPLNTRELLAEVGSPVVQRVALFKGDVPSPMADLYISLQARYVDEWLGEFVAHLDGFNGAGSYLAERAICELVPFLLGRLGSPLGSRNNGIFWDLCGSKLNLRLLLHGSVCRRPIRGKGID